MTGSGAGREETCFAVAPPGMDDLVAAELTALGVAIAQVEAAGVTFRANRRTLLQVNRGLRVASRVLVRVGDFRCRDFPALFRQALKLPWGRYLRPGTPLAVRASSQQSRLIHTGRLAATLTDAVRRALGQVPDDPALPLQSLFLRLDNDQCTLSIDSSGDHLHRRGYRQEQGEAALRENLAAGILLRSGWQPGLPLLDPCCGSGTLVIEAALMAAGLAPGAQRTFALMHWPHYRPVPLAPTTPPAQGLCLYGSDRAPAMLELARRNADRAGVADLCHWETRDLAAWEQPPAEQGWVVCNPPYGIRLGNRGTPAAIARLLTELASRWPCWTITCLTPDPGLYQRPEVLGGIDNGGQKVTLLRVRAATK